MMKKYFVLGFIALSALLTSHPGSARAEWIGADSSSEASEKTAGWTTQEGTASYYGRRWNGRRTSSGAVFDQRELTAAHAWLPFGTRVRVTLAETGRSVIVVITDRLPSRRRIVDLSVAAARELGIIQRGVAFVTLSPG
jgi:rare lipoprotein A